MAARWTRFLSAAAEAALRTQFSILPMGMPLTAPTSGLRGLSLPGLTVLAAWGRKGTGGTLTGCGQELPRLKLERPEKGGGQPSGCSYRSGREERREKKRLNWQRLLAVQRARAACPAPCYSFLVASTSAQEPITPGADRPTVRSPPDS
ncbi:uncharacterized protein M6G45_017158 [Spheniscus humboldti]